MYTMNYTAIKVLKNGFNHLNSIFKHILIFQTEMVCQPIIIINYTLIFKDILFCRYSVFI